MLLWRLAGLPEIPTQFPRLAWSTRYALGVFAFGPGCRVRRHRHRLGGTRLSRRLRSPCEFCASRRFSCVRRRCLGADRTAFERHRHACRRFGGWSAALLAERCSSEYGFAPYPRWRRTVLSLASIVASEPQSKQSRVIRSRRNRREERSQRAGLRQRSSFLHGR